MWLHFRLSSEMNQIRIICMHRIPNLRIQIDMGRRKRNRSYKCTQRSQIDWPKIQSVVLTKINFVLRSIAVNCFHLAWKQIRSSNFVPHVFSRFSIKNHSKKSAGYRYTVRKFHLYVTMIFISLLNQNYNMKSKIAPASHLSEPVIAHEITGSIGFDVVMRIDNGSRIHIVENEGMQKIIRSYKIGSNTWL